MIRYSIQRTSQIDDISIIELNGDFNEAGKFEVTKTVKLVYSNDPEFNINDFHILQRWHTVFDKHQVIKSLFWSE